MTPVTIHSWFNPHANFALDGVGFVTNGHFALAADMPEAAKDLPGAPVRKYLDAARAVVTEVRERGFVLLDGITFAGHGVGLVEAAYPGVAWTVGGDRESGWAIGRLDGALVGLLMCIIPRGPDELCIGPDCPVCEGHGGPECKACGGSGETECHSCGHDMECKKCDGDGTMGRCVACGGAKVWKPSCAS